MTELPASLRDTIARLAPGTALRDGLERILRGRTGALVVLGFDETVARMCDGGFEIDIAFAPTRLRELCKMDGAVVLTTDGSRIVRANVQLVPDPTIPTVESGTRHRAAERTAVQTGFPVVAVSQSMSIVSVYVGGIRHVIASSPTILSRANQAIATLERYRSRLDDDMRQLTVAEIEDVATLYDALTAIQRLEMVRRVSAEIENDILELGSDGRQLSLQREELAGDNKYKRELVVRDYLVTDGTPSADQVAQCLSAVEQLSDSDLLDLPAIGRTLGYSAATPTLEQLVSSRGYRLLSRVPRLSFDKVEQLVSTFGTLQAQYAASVTDLREIPGIGDGWARQIRETLARLAEASLAGPLH